MYCAESFGREVYMEKAQFLWSLIIEFNMVSYCLIRLDLAIFRLEELNVWQKLEFA